MVLNGRGVDGDFIILDSRSAADDITGHNSHGCVAGIHHQLCLVDDRGIVVLRVVGDDDDAVELRNLVERRAGHIERILTAATDGGEKGSLYSTWAPRFCSSSMM